VPTATAVIVADVVAGGWTIQVTTAWTVDPEGLGQSRSCRVRASRVHVSGAIQALLAPRVAAPSTTSPPIPTASRVICRAVASCPRAGRWR